MPFCLIGSRPKLSYFLDLAPIRNDIEVQPIIIGANQAFLGRYQTVIGSLKLCDCRIV